MTDNTKKETMVYYKGQEYKVIKNAKGKVSSIYRADGTKVSDFFTKSEPEKKLFQIIKYRYYRKCEAEKDSKNNVAKFTACDIEGPGLGLQKGIIFGHVMKDARASGAVVCANTIYKGKSVTFVTVWDDFSHYIVSNDGKREVKKCSSSSSDYDFNKNVLKDLNSVPTRSVSDAEEVEDIRRIADCAYIQIGRRSVPEHRIELDGETFFVSMDYHVVQEKLVVKTENGEFIPSNIKLAKDVIEALDKQLLKDQTSKLRAQQSSKKQDNDYSISSANSLRHSASVPVTSLSRSSSAMKHSYYK